MLERILLASIITFCIYLFLNLGGKSSQTPALDAHKTIIPEFVTQATLLIW